ncbi:hypothetical protein HanRHA438_Chr15g0688511 [Helianthus annuus]|nr:hypothetical protein HanHA89_Chr15g0599741 [Helianthus annuus]KAJ0647395.1 hypothetical protein HanLR1_Chr15g0561391 [Helianthus annuus]KAJ0843177.1 hypothetical protein HanRHA438_Chr15g0688511 [Helianthus annuus]
MEGLKLTKNPLMGILGKRPIWVVWKLALRLGDISICLECRIMRCERKKNKI